MTREVGSSLGGEVLDCTRAQLSQASLDSLFPDGKTSPFLCLCWFIRFYLSLIVYSFVLGIDLSVLEYSVTVSFGKFSSIFLPGLHVLIDSVLLTTYI